MSVSAHAGEILDLLDDPSTNAEAVRHIPDGLLVIEDGEIAAVGARTQLAPSLPDDVHIAKHLDGLIVPGFIDCHVHFPQLDVIAAPGEQLMDWLERYTFPAEAAYADCAYARTAAKFFIEQLLIHGTTTALAFAPVHAEAVDALFEAALSRNMRLIAGKVLMDRNAPEALLETAEAGEAITRNSIQRWRGRGRLGYAVTPRFAPACSAELLEAAGRLLADNREVLLQTHLAESREETAKVESLFPEAQDYLDVYDRHGLLGERSVFAHCVHIDAGARRRIADAGARVAFCPTSNLFLGSGLFDYAAAREAGLRVGLGTDIGAGTSLSLFDTVNEAYKVCHLQGKPMAPMEAFHLATLGGARTLRLDSRIGNFEPGKEADFLVLDPAATPLIAHRIAQCRSLEERLFALMMLGDDRAVREVYLAGELAVSKGLCEGLAPIAPK